jgi:hypothetical protein
MNYADYCNSIQEKMEDEQWARAFLHAYLAGELDSKEAKLELVLEVLREGLMIWCKDPKMSQ